MDNLEELKKEARVNHVKRAQRPILELERLLRKCSWEIAKNEGFVPTELLEELADAVADEVAERYKEKAE